MNKMHLNELRTVESFPKHSIVRITRFNKVFALLALCILIQPATAGLISVNLTNTDGPRQIQPSESTGVIDTIGWVNLQLSGPSGNETNIGGTVIDLAWSASSVGTSNTMRDSGSGDGTDGFLALFEAGLRSSNSSTPAHATLSDLTAFMTNESATSYDVYVYYKSPLTNASPDTISVNGTNYDPDGSKISVSDSFVSAGNSESNYILFSGLSSDTFDIDVARVQRDAIFAGFQVVATAVPEPSSFIFLGLVSLLGFVAVRWNTAK